MAAKPTPKAFFFWSNEPHLIRDVKKSYSGMTDNRFDSICQHYGIDRDSWGKDFVAIHDFHAAVQLIKAKRTWLKSANRQNWYEEFLKEEGIKHRNWQNTISQWTSENFTINDYPPLTLSAEVMTKLREIDSLYSPAPVQPIHVHKRTKSEELKSVPKRTVAGTTIKIYCRKKECRKEYDAVTGCKHPIESKCYTARFYVPHRPNKPIRKWLQSRYLDDVIIEAKTMLNALKETSYNKTEFVPQIKQEKLKFLHDAVKEYIAFKKDEDDEQKNGDSYFKEIESSLGILERFLKKQGYDSFLLENFENKEIIKKLYSELKKETYTKEDENNHKIRGGKKVGDIKWSKRTINNFTNKWSSFIIWLKDNKKIDIINPFPNEMFKVSYTPLALEDEEYEALIKYMESNPTLPPHHSGKISENDLNWLHISFVFLRTYDLRKIDLLSLRWSDIRLHKKGFYIMRSINHKATALKKSDTPIYRYDAIEKHIFKLLKPFGIEEKIGISDDYIIEQDGVKGKVSRKRLYYKLSIGFTHVAKSVFGNDFPLKNRSLRKAKLTENDLLIGEDAWQDSHSSKKVFVDYYVDSAIKAIKAAEANPNTYRIKK